MSNQCQHKSDDWLMLQHLHFSGVPVWLLSLIQTGPVCVKPLLPLMVYDW